MKSPVKFGILLALLGIFSSNAEADWAILGAAAECASDGSSFSLDPVIKTSEPSYDVNPKSGSYLFKNGKDQNYECQLGTKTVRITLTVFGPQSSGQGQGSGGVLISRLLVGDVEIIKNSTNFNWSISGEPVLTQIQVTRVGERYSWSMCYSDGWDWEHPFGNKKCEVAGVR